MKTISLQATADLLETASISKSIDMGHFIAHKGIEADGTAFLLVNGGADGESVIVRM
jgi:hypothetical protein